jgi:hypothetical protein
LLAVIMVLFLLEGTSMIYSWEFGQEETWMVSAIAVALGGLFFALAFGTDTAHVVKNFVERRRK